MLSFKHLTLRSSNFFYIKIIVTFINNGRKAIMTLERLIAKIIHQFY